MTRLLLLFSIIVGKYDCLFIEGCPLFGCRPSGSFSMYLNVTHKNVSIAWETRFPLNPVPSALGCVANDVSVVCQSNGPFKEDTGYLSLDGMNGSVQWRDKVLRFPALPILDNYGDLTGSDGAKLVHYDKDGKLYPIIPCEGLKPVLSLQLVGSDFLLLVSGQGEMVVRETNGVPVAFLVLNEVIQKVKGRFVPLAQPVVNGNRFYILTHFVPENGTVHSLELKRLYAIDVHHSLVNRITVAWFYDFENLISGPNKEPDANFEKDNDNINSYIWRRARKNNEDRSTGQNLLWDSRNNLVYVILPSSNLDRDIGNTVLALKDFGNHSSLTFRLGLDIKHMAVFEPNTDIDRTPSHSSVKNWLWLVSANGTCLAVESNGSVTRIINMTMVLGTDVFITSKVVLSRTENNGSDILVFALQPSKHTVAFTSILKRHGIPCLNTSSYIIAINSRAEQNSNDLILWIVPVPENMTVKGQISGSQGASTGRKDEIIFYAENVGALELKYLQFAEQYLSHYLEATRREM